MATRNKALEYLTTTKIGEKGQLIVLKVFREDLGLATGARFAVLRFGYGLVLLWQQQRFESLGEQLGSDLTGAGLAEAVLATLPKFASASQVHAESTGGEGYRNAFKANLSPAVRSGCLALPSSSVFRRTGSCGASYPDPVSG